MPFSLAIDLTSRNALPSLDKPTRVGVSHSEVAFARDTPSRASPRELSLVQFTDECHVGRKLFGEILPIEGLRKVQGKVSKV